MASLRQRVRVRLSELGFLGSEVLQPQPPHFGVVTKVDADPPTLNDVLFDNGVLVKDVPVAGLDLVSDASQNSITALLYAVVRPAGLAASQEYTGKVVDLYRINSQTEFALVRTRNGMYYEQRTSLLVRVDLEGVPQ